MSAVADIFDSGEFACAKFSTPWRSTSVALGNQDSKEPLEVDLERFFAMIRFDQREKLTNLPNFQDNLN
jgi:hypothetical protein